MSELLRPEDVKPFSFIVNEALECLNAALFGRDKLHKLLLTAIFARGHILLEGLPGLGKTALVNCLGQLLKLEFKRVQFTPDLLPGDILGTHILQENSEGRREMIFQAGPVFSNILLGDEINRASPKTQSALLEAMQEKTVTLLGEMRKLPEPFFVLATQNPIELEGTYPLPEAQLDRFLFKLEIDAPETWVMEKIILERHRGEIPPMKALMDSEKLKEIFDIVDQIQIPQAVAAYIARIVEMSSHKGQIDGISEYIRYGASPRAAIAIAEASRAWAFIEGRPSVGFDDVKATAKWALHHRLVLDYRAKAEKISSSELAARIVDKAPMLANNMPAGVSVA